jgi:hypothetical protein
VVSVASHRDYLEVLIELDVILAVLALGVINFKVAAALHLAPRAAMGFQGSLDLLALCGGTGVSASAKMLLTSAAANAIEKCFICCASSKLRRLN